MPSLLSNICYLTVLLGCFTLSKADLRGSWSLDYKCSGPNNTCGPSNICTGVYNNAKACNFTAVTYDYAALAAGTVKDCKVCTQSTDARCSNASLKAAIKGSAIKLAYCNDKYLVIHSDGKPSWTPALMNIPWPPRTTDSVGDACVGRAITPRNMGQTRIPLTFTALSTSSAATNNIANGGFTTANAYCISMQNEIYAVPSQGSIGVTVDGADIFPAFSNNGGKGQEQCEFGACMEHVGEGGGVPHVHGDPFGPNCLYSASNYTTLASHPPLIGWSRDGGSIYGRHLSKTAPGFTTALDECGGHSHGTYGYHYHA